MTIKSSGILSFTDIQTEMGGVNPIGLNEYYGGGAYTPSGIGIPTSGLIDVGSFYGKTKTVVTASHSVVVGQRTTTTPNYYGYDAWGTPVIGSRNPTTYKTYSILQISWYNNAGVGYLKFGLSTSTNVLAQSFLTSITVNGTTYTGTGASSFSTNVYAVTTWVWTGVATNPFSAVGTTVPVNLV